MSIQCPHCQGTINVTITMTAGDPPAKVEPPVADPIPTVKPATTFRTNTDVGLFRQCLHDVGLPLSARDGSIYNDKNTASRRLKLDYTFGDERELMYDPSGYTVRWLTDRCKQAFGARFIRGELYGCGYVLHLEL
jgi:hypothetical protein